MKTALLLLCSALCAVSAAPSLRVQITVTDAHGKTHALKPKHDKLYVAPIGKQCAYDPAIDPSMYPCRDGGVCVRTSPTYGKCYTKQEAAQIHSKNKKLYVTPIGKQCAYDPKIDPSMYPCRDGGVCVRTSPTYGKCYTKQEAAQIHSNPKNKKLYVTPIGKQCAYDPKIDPSMYPCRDGGVCVRTSPTYGKCYTKQEAAQIHSNPKNKKLYVTPLGKQCAYDPAIDPSLYPCRDGGVCVRTSPTYGKCFTKEEAASLQTASGSDDSDDSDDSDSASGSADDESDEERDNDSADENEDENEDESEDESEEQDGGPFTYDTPPPEKKHH